MGLVQKIASKRITRLIYKFTGQDIVPTLTLPCRSSISEDWNGWCALDSQSIWLVDGYGARGVLLENIRPSSNYGPFQDAFGLTRYHFKFNFREMNDGFSVYPKNSLAGAEMFQHLEAWFEDSSTPRPTLDTQLAVEVIHYKVRLSEGVPTFTAILLINANATCSMDSPALFLDETPLVSWEIIETLNGKAIMLQTSIIGFDVTDPSETEIATAWLEEFLPNLRRD